MRILATFAAAFSLGIYAAQYLLPERYLLYGAVLCFFLGCGALLLPERWRRRGVLIGAALALALGWDWLYLRQAYAPLASLAGTRELDPSAGILANERQYASASRALACVQEAQDALECGMTLDAVTVSIESAIQELLELTGERASETVVDNVFHRFCVGK